SLECYCSLRQLVSLPCSPGPAERRRRRRAGRREGEPRAGQGASAANPGLNPWPGGRGGACGAARRQPSGRVALRRKSRDNGGRTLVSTPSPPGDRRLAKPNYAFAKRQRELAKKQKKEEKLKRKAEQSETSGAPGEEEAQAGESAERTPPDDQSAA